MNARTHARTQIPGTLGRNRSWGTPAIFNTSTVLTAIPRPGGRVTVPALDTGPLVSDVTRALTEGVAVLTKKSVNLTTLPFLKNNGTHCQSVCSCNHCKQTPKQLDKRKKKGTDEVFCSR